LANLLHGDPNAVGRPIRVNRYELTVIGITPPEFRGTMPGMAMDMWIPITMAPQLNGQGNWLLDSRTDRQMWITGRLTTGVSIEQANAEVEACSWHMAEESPSTSAGFQEIVLPVWKAHFGVQVTLLSPLRILMAVCFVLFLIATANLANLQLARAPAQCSRWRPTFIHCRSISFSGLICRYSICSHLKSAAGRVRDSRKPLWNPGSAMKS
jgi:hypothetical protein